MVIPVLVTGKIGGTLSELAKIAMTGEIVIGSIAKAKIPNRSLEIPDFRMGEMAVGGSIVRNASGTVLVMLVKTKEVGLAEAVAVVGVAKTEVERITENVFAGENEKRDKVLLRGGVAHGKLGVRNLVGDRNCDEGAKVV